MKRLFAAALFAAVTAMVCLPAVAGTKAGPSGKIVNDQGQTIKVIEFLDLVDTLPYMYEQSQQTAPLKDIKSLTDLGDGYLQLENIKGQSFKVIVMFDAVTLKEMINYKAEDPISGKVEKNEIDGEFVKQIEFDWKK